MDELNQLQHLKTNHYCGFEGELAIAEVEHFLQWLPQVVHDHDVIISFLTDIVDLRNVDLFTYTFVLDQLWNEFRFVKKLGSFRKGILNFQGNFWVVQNIGGEENLTEGSLPQLFLYQVVL